jgi:hypothetical protein
MALLFVGDVAADALADLAAGHCETQTSQSSGDHSKEPCSHCSCAVHAGAVVIPDPASDLQGMSRSTARLRSDDDAHPPRLAALIDHPPQLA